MHEERVVVVGAGAAGLSVAGALKHLGLSAVVLDRDSAVGDSWRRRYDRLHLHTVRAFSGLPRFPIPRSFEKYLSRDMYARYLQLYRQHHGIEVVHDCDVRSIRCIDGTDGRAPQFLLETNLGEWRARAVVVATGMYRDRVVPAFTGVSRYQGRTMHSADYVSGKAFAGKRVLVVGIGNTGAEIATDLVEQGAQYVAISVRGAPPIVPRDFLGTPVQLFGIVLSRFPARIADAIGQLVSRIALGDLRRYGLGTPQWLPFSARRIPVIDVGFVSNLKRGRISIRPEVARFTEQGVVYADGREEQIDAVVFATGYRTGLGRMLDVPGLLDENGYPNFPSGARTSRRGLYFMGFFESHRGLLFETAIASMRLARIMRRDLATLK